MLTGKASGVMCRLREGQGASMAQKRHETGFGFEPKRPGFQSDLRGNTGCNKGASRTGVVHLSCAYGGRGLRGVAEGC